MANIVKEFMVDVTVWGFGTTCLARKVEHI